MSGQRTLSLEFREFDTADYARLCAVYNANYPDYPRSVTEWRSRDESIDRSKYHLKRYACVDRETGVTVGFGDVSHVTDMFHPRKFWINLWVDPNNHGRGIASAIYKKLYDELEELNAITAWTMSKEDLPKLSEFFRRRGFQDKLTAWESRLDVSTTDTNRFREYPEKVSKQGITITNLALERKRDPGSLRKLHELVQLISADIPSPAPFTPISYEQWEAFELKNPNLLPDGYMIAKDGSNYVGLSTVWRSERETKGLYQGNTGVRREYRGRGIAIALKLRVIDFARQNGYAKVKTFNASNNASMLAVNTKLGFKREIGWITMGKDLVQKT